MHSLTPLPAGPFRFVALDVETANYSAASICQIGIACVRLDNSIETWASLVDPRDSFLSGNVGIHGITPKMVEGAPVFAQVWRHLQPLLDKYTIFQHSTFDSRSLKAAAAVAGFELPDLAWSDSVTLARRVWPEFRGAGGGHGLANLKRELGLTFRHHDAGEDARAAAEVVLKAEAKAGEDFSVLSKPLKKGQSVWHEPRLSLEGNPEGPFFGEEIVFTGAMRISRELAAQKAAALGYRIAPRLSPSTTLVVEGAQDKRALGAQGLSRTARAARALQAEGQALVFLDAEAFLTLLRRAEA